MSVNGASMTFGIIYLAICCNLWELFIYKVLAALSGKTVQDIFVTVSENECQGSAKDFWSCKSGNSNVI